jgi:hypothetical protein
MALKNFKYLPKCKKILLARADQQHQIIRSVWQRPQAPIIGFSEHRIQDLHHENKE